MGPTRRDAGRSAPLCGPRSGLALEARGGRHVARWRGHLTPGPRVAAATQLSYAVVRWRSLRRSRACKVQSVCARQGAGCRLRTRGGGLISSVAREAHEEAEGPSYRRLLGSHTAQCINPHAYSCTSMYISHVHVPPISTHDLYMTCTYTRTIMHRMYSCTWTWQGKAYLIHQDTPLQRTQCMCSQDDMEEGVGGDDGNEQPSLALPCLAYMDIMYKN